MGKTRKRFNWKARIREGQSVDDSKADFKNTVQLDLEVREEQYDASNPLLLPIYKKKKKGQKLSEKATPKKKVLSKKQKRRLAQIIEKKKKHVNRSELLQKLQEVQATSEELELMTSTSSMQTHGSKKHAVASGKQNTPASFISSIKGSNRKKNRPEDVEIKRVKLDPNIAGLEESDEDDSSDSDSEMEDDNKHHKTNLLFNTKGNEKESAQNLNQKVVDTLPKSQVHEIKDRTGEKSNEVAVLNETVSSPMAKDTPCQPAVFVPVMRSPDIQAIRESLPIYSEEQSIMEAIKENPVVIIHGATGSGKTTQVPQFLYEAGYTRDKKLIGITEPRRIAAVQMAARVAEEMNLPDAVSYQIRYEKTATDDKTEIKFMTDGVLLKEIRSDFLLSRYSVIIIDEAHERSIFSDVLIGLLSRILPLREKKGNPLKLIIMSATLRIEDFMENPRLFKQKPFLITLNSRQYDVVLHFNTKTPDDYVKAACDKVCKIHRQLPSGAILVFVTGEKEVTRLCKMLRKAFPFEENANMSKSLVSDPEFVNKKFKFKRQRKKQQQAESFCDLPKINLDDYSIEPLDTEGIQHQHSDDDDDNLDDEIFSNIFSLGPCEPLHVLPLYSVLPIEEQAKIFKPPPAGCRLCVVATNVAETSVTIPGLKYVVDTGKVKTRVYDKTSSGVSSFVITWTSKASANQRAGRAGRTEGGHCYRLYSSAVFDHEFPEFTLPDIQRIPIDDILLQMKALGIDRVVNFPFPSAPDAEALKAAEKRLVMLGALQNLQKGNRFKEITKWEYSAKVTPLGKAMSRFSVSPRYAKMLLLSYMHEVVAYIVAIVAAMTVPEVFLSSEVPKSEDNADEADTTSKHVYVGVNKIGAGKGKSLKLGDAMVLLKAVATYEEAKNKHQFCTKYHIRQKAMLEIQKMRLQLTREMNRTFYDLELPLDLTLKPPDDSQIEKLRKILTASSTDHVARKIPIEEQNTKVKLKNAYKSQDVEEMLFVHPSSILSKEAPEYIVYQEIFQTTKYFMRTVIEIEPEWLTAFAPDQCEFSKPLETPPPYYDSETDKIMCSMTATFGRWNWELPQVCMPMPSSLTKFNFFCFCLLDGQICKFFKSYKKSLLSPPTVMLKQWARLLPRTRLLLQAVIDENIDSREALLKAWKGNPQYLLQEYCQWLPDSKRMEVVYKWPPTDTE